MPSTSSGSSLAGLGGLFGLGSSPTKLLNQWGSLGALTGLGDLLKPSTSTATHSTPTAPQKPTIKPTSSFEMKYLESLSNNFMKETVAKTPTQKPAGISTNSLSTLARAGTTISGARNSSGSANRTKKTSSSLPSTPTGLPGIQGLKLPTDLPKSLSITPTGPTVKPNQSSMVTTMPERRKSTYKKFHDQGHPYASTKLNRKPLSTTLDSLKTNPALSITPESGGAARTGNYTSPTSLLSSYENFLKSYPFQINPGGLVSAAPKVSPAPSKKPQAKAQTAKRNSTPTPLPAHDSVKHISTFSSLPKSSPTTSIKSLPSPQQRELMISKSPYSTISGRSSTSLTPTPPLSASPSIQASPKTLQQKLAEKQKQNQQNQQKLNKNNGELFLLFLFFGFFN
jgi:hypothetical protein